MLTPFISYAYLFCVRDFNAVRVSTPVSPRKNFGVLHACLHRAKRDALRALCHTMRLAERERKRTLLRELQACIVASLAIDGKSKGTGDGTTHLLVLHIIWF